MTDSCHVALPSFSFNLTINEHCLSKVGKQCQNFAEVKFYLGVTDFFFPTDSVLFLRYQIQEMTSCFSHTISIASSQWESPSI